MHFIDPAPRGPELRPQSTAAAAKGGGAGGAEALAAGTGGWTRGLRSRRARARAVHCTTLRAARKRAI